MVTETIGTDALHEGQEWVSVGRTVTETDIQLFAGLSGDFNQLHTNEVWVREHTPFHGRVAHGLLILALSSGIRTPGFDDLDIRAYLSTSREMKAPIYPGDTITVTNTILDIRPSRSNPKNAVLSVGCVVVDDSAETVQEGTDIFLIGPGSEGDGFGQ